MVDYPRGPVSVMCCKCGGLLAADLHTILFKGTKIVSNGSVNYVTDKYLDWGRVARFPSAMEADATVSKAGWSIQDDMGRPDHTCPDCRAASHDDNQYNQHQHQHQRGAYVSWRNSQ